MSFWLLLIQELRGRNLILGSRSQSLFRGDGKQHITALGGCFGCLTLATSGSCGSRTSAPSPHFCISLGPMGLRG
ncbi:hypothetical protein VTJ04DRAFT_5807 [Mycothermus thermophilus]|uniref:uncharacterized protein n=1 Tax=Humicola insolens TaxID=85995 RepID=UPI0037435968